MISENTQETICRGLHVRTSRYCNLVHEKYNVAISFGVTTSRMRRINCVLDTSTRPSPLRENLVYLDWLPLIRLCDSPRLKIATNQRVEVIGRISLHVQIEEGHIRVTFGIFRNLAVPVLLGTSFINNFAKGIFPGEKKMIPFNSPTVLILTMLERETDQTEEQQEDTVTNIISDQYFTQELVRVACTVTLRSLSETSVLFATNAGSIVQLDAFTHCRKLPMIISPTSDWY